MTSTDNKQEQLEDAYTRTGKRTKRKKTVTSVSQDERFGYAEPAKCRRSESGGEETADRQFVGSGLYRLGNMGRGTFQSGTLNKDFEHGRGGACPVLAGNPLGNWDNFKQDDNGNGSWDLNQTRAHTKANEIEEIDADSSVVSHDPAGNITKSPQPGNWGGTYDYVWDAWNRLVRIISGRSNVAIFRYDGEHKRITKTASSITRHFYYSLDWQILEERLDEETEPLRQYVWNPNPDRMDDLVLRDEGAGGSGSSSSGTQQRLYALNDLMNVTAIVDDDGNVVERYGYSPFGESRVMNGSFGPRTSSDFDWELRYKTYPLDLESGLYQVRHRYLHPGLGRWMSRDPIKYRGGANLYGFVLNDPVNGLDVFGLQGSQTPPGDFPQQPPSEEGFSLLSLPKLQFTRSGEIRGKGAAPLPWPRWFFVGGGFMSVEKGWCCDDDNTRRDFVDLSGGLVIGIVWTTSSPSDRPLEFELEAGGDVKKAADCPPETSVLNATFSVSIEASAGVASGEAGCSNTYVWGDGWMGWNCWGGVRFTLGKPNVTVKGSFRFLASGVLYLD